MGAQPLGGHPPQPCPLRVPDRVERPGGTALSTGHARLDLAEDEVPPVGGDDVELAVAGPEVAVDELVSRRTQMPRGSVLA